MHISSYFTGRLTVWKIIIGIAAGTILGVWMTYTPEGILGKADAIGYAVCHQISVRSFFLGDRQIPLCARCTGMYLGALAGIIYQARGKRLGGMPVRKISIILGIFFLAFAFDGINSYLQLYPFVKPLYITQNWMRLLTGTGLGIVMSAVLLPVFNQTMWADWSDQPILHSWKQISILLALSLVVDAAVLSENPLLLFPLALLSSGTVILLLTMIYTLIWTLLLKKENAFQNLNQMAGFLTAGFATTMLQIGIMDLIRYLITGTWNGFFFG